jgi:hypothetical protein
MHLRHGPWMDRLIAMHRSDQTHFVSVLAKFREQLGHPQTAFASLMKLPRRSHELCPVGTTGFAFVTPQARLVVESI